MLFIFGLFVLNNTAKQAAMCVKLAGKIEATINEHPPVANYIIPNVINGQCNPKITNG